MDGRAAMPLGVLGDGEEVDREATGPSGCTLCSTSGGIACVEPELRTTFSSGRVRATNRRLPSCTTMRPRVPAAMRCERPRPPGIVRSSNCGLVRTLRRRSGSSARSHRGQSSGVPSRSSRPAVSNTHSRSWKGGRSMANVLAMPTGEVSYPVAFVVLVVAEDRSPHEFSVAMRSDGTCSRAWRQERTGRRFPLRPTTGRWETPCRRLMAHLWLCDLLAGGCHFSPYVFSPSVARLRRPRIRRRQGHQPLLLPPRVPLRPPPWSSQSARLPPCHQLQQLLL